MWFLPLWAFGRAGVVSRLCSLSAPCTRSVWLTARDLRCVHQGLPWPAAGWAGWAVSPPWGAPGAAWRDDKAHTLLACRDHSAMQHSGCVLPWCCHFPAAALHRAEPLCVLPRLPKVVPSSQLAAGLPQPRLETRRSHRAELQTVPPTQPGAGGLCHAVPHTCEEMASCGHPRASSAAAQGNHPGNIVVVRGFRCLQGSCSPEAAGPILEQCLCPAAIR